METVLKKDWPLSVPSLHVFLPPLFLLSVDYESESDYADVTKHSLFHWLKKTTTENMVIFKF